MGKSGGVMDGLGLFPFAFLGGSGGSGEVKHPSELDSILIGDSPSDTVS